MYWWNAFKLAEDLREGRVEEKERFKYYLAHTIVVGGVVLVPAPCFPETFHTVDLIHNLAHLIIIITGTFLCYRANRSGDNADFIGRMICLSWPVGIKVSVVFLLVGAFAALFIYVAFGIEFEFDSDMAMAISIYSEVMEIYLYGLLYKRVKLAARPLAPRVGYPPE